MGTLRVFYYVAVISSLLVCLLPVLWSEWCLFYLLRIFAVVGFVITGLPIQPFFYYVCYPQAMQTFWLWPIWGCPGGDQRMRVRVRKCEQSGKSTWHLPPKWKVSPPGLPHMLMVRRVVGAMEGWKGKSPCAAGAASGLSHGPPAQAGLHLNRQGTTADKAGSLCAFRKIKMKPNPAFVGRPGI